MEIRNLKFYKKARTVAAAVALSATLAGNPMIAYAEEANEDIATENTVPEEQLVETENEVVEEPKDEEVSEERETPKETMAEEPKLEAQSTKEEKKTASNETEVITEETATFNGTYDTKEEANAKKEEKEKEYNKAGYENIKSEINETKTLEETGNVIEEYIGSSIVVEKEKYVYDTEEEANAKKEELESSTDPHDIVITVTINKISVDSGEDETKDITKSFASEEEANAYIESLKEDGYEVTNITITQDSHTEERSIDETYDTYEKAEEALNEFSNKYDDVVADEIKENKTETVIETINGETPYETKDEADAALEEFLNDPNNETKEYYFTGEVTGPTPTGEYETTTINETFNSKEEALEYLDQLEQDGYIINEYTFTNDQGQEFGKLEQKYNSMEELEQALEEFKAQYPNDVTSSVETVEAGTVYEAETITQDMKIYQVGNTTFVIIKKGHDVYVWTADELTEDEQSNFKETYKDIASDHVLTGDVVASDSTIFINGYREFTSSNGKIFTFSLDDNNEIQIDMASGAESRVVYGTFEPVLQYILTASGNKSYDLDSGVLTGEKAKEILAYYVNLVKRAKTYSIKATGNETVYDDSYTLIATTIKDILKDKFVLDVLTEFKDYNYTSEVIEKIIYNLTVKADVPVITPEHKPNITPNPVIKPETIPAKEEEALKPSTAPQTGDESDLAWPLAGMVGSATALAGVALVKKRKYVKTKH